MNEMRLRAWHRWLGVLLSPFLFLQTLSGVLFSFGLYRGVRSALREVVPEAAEGPVASAFDARMARMHCGAGHLGYAYHVVLGLGILVLIASGV